MGILMGLLAAMAAVGLLLWRLNAASQAARELVDTADEARGFFRRLAWSRKAKKHPLDMVEDPREAATAMMVALAQYKGPLTESQERLILSEMVSNFSVPTEEAREILARARWMTRDATDVHHTLSRLAPAIDKTCTTAEKRELIGMLKVVADPGDVRQDVLANAIKSLEDRLLPKRPH
ncbi:MAG: TerB family tellurite resistance protein [Hyphomicrobiaceae bacterium]